MTTIQANVSRMFRSLEPWDVSNSVANLGPNAAQLTWNNALKIAETHHHWLGTPLEEACEGMREWMRESGGWDRSEIEEQSQLELLALFAQTIASELREHLDADDVDLEASLSTYLHTDWNAAPTSPIGSYYSGEHGVMVDYYTGI